MPRSAFARGSRPAAHDAHTRLSPLPLCPATVVIHVFTPDQREHYDIESFYAAAEEVDLPFAAPDRQQGGAAAAPAGGWAKQL